MKTYNQVGIKMLLFIFAVVTLINCKKNEDINFLLQNEWKAKSIHIDKTTLKVPTKNFREEAYIFKITNDSCFLLPTSVNYAGGKYIITTEGNINMNYGIFTRVCCENDFDKQMIKIMNEINSYYCKGNRLFFLTDKNEKIIFEKQ